MIDATLSDLQPFSGSYPKLFIPFSRSLFGEKMKTLATLRLCESFDCINKDEIFIMSRGGKKIRYPPLRLFTVPYFSVRSSRSSASYLK